MTFRIASVFVLAVTFMLAARAPVLVQTRENRAPLTITLGNQGLASLRYAGTEMLARGELSVQKVLLTRAAGSAATDRSATPTRTVSDVHRKTLTQTYPWGIVRCTYTVKPDNRLELTLGVHNDSDSTLSGFAIQLMELQFPAPPKGWLKDYAYFGDNRGNPTVEYANFGTGALAVCNDDLTRPLLVGFPGRADLGGPRPLWVCTSNIPGYLSPFLDPYLKRPIPPHGSDVFHISLRFGVAAATEMDLGADLYRRMAAAHPTAFVWEDRRPIGTLHLSTSEAYLHSPANPRGWFADPRGVDVKTAAGIEAFHRRVLKYADDSIVVLKSMNAQGMVTWDVEGQEFPHATSYIGDPRLLPTLDPEMDSVADAYFRKFRDAGLRTGICVRPQLLKHTPEKTEQTEVTDPAQIINTLFDKIVYAYRRWGCTLFYVDSNGDPNVPYDPAIFEALVARLRQARIKALIMPEHRNLRYYACTAPYGELRNGVTGTPAAVRAAYPHAFIANYVPDGPLNEQHDKLTAAVRRGDILMFRAWWNDPTNDAVRRLYHESGR